MSGAKKFSIGLLIKCKVNLGQIHFLLRYGYSVQHIITQIALLLVQAGRVYLYDPLYLINLINWQI